jgi:hypothetical protein
MRTRWPSRSRLRHSNSRCRRLASCSSTVGTRSRTSHRIRPCGAA